jgi:hypothetical protein
MGSRVPLRRDFDGQVLRRLAKHSKDAKQTRRFPTIQVYPSATLLMESIGTAVIDRGQSQQTTSPSVPANTFYARARG